MRHQVTILNDTQELIDQYEKAEPANVAAGSSKSMKFMKPAPLETTMDNLPFNQDGDSASPVGCEFPSELLHLLPDPLDDLQLGQGDDNIRYNIRENGTRNGRAVIEDSRGYTYSFQRQNKGDPPKYTYWLCIKRQGGNTNNCKASLRVEKYHEGQDHMIVKKTRSRT